MRTAMMKIFLTTLFFCLVAPGSHLLKKNFRLNNCWNRFVRDGRQDAAANKAREQAFLARESRTGSEDSRRDG